MTLPLLSSVLADDSSSSLSNDTSGVDTPSFDLNSFLIGELSNPEPNIRRRDDDVTVSDDFNSTLPSPAEDPRHPDVAFARSLVNSCLRAPELEPRNGGECRKTKATLPVLRTPSRSFTIFGN